MNYQMTSLYRLADLVRGRRVEDKEAYLILNVGKWGDFYPVAVEGVFDGRIASTYEAGFIVSENGKYAMPIFEDF